MKVYSSYEGGSLQIILQGELDQHGVKGSMEAIDGLLEEYLPRDCVLDLSSLSFMDSSGIALILKLSRRMQREGGTLRVEHPAPQPRRVLEAAGVERMALVSLRREGETV